MTSRKMLWVSYIMSALPVLMLLFSGMMKLVKPPSVVEGFAHLGYDDSCGAWAGPGRTALHPLVRHSSHVRTRRHSV